MSSHWQQTGYVLPESLSLPDSDRLGDRMAPIIECPQKIPCDPCKTVCPANAIVMDNINELPQINYDDCTGCGLCIQSCPGLAIFGVHHVEKDKSRVVIPYELTPLPAVNDNVKCLNRKGEKVCWGQVKDVKPRTETRGDTSLVTVEIPREFWNQVRWFELKGGEDGG